MTSACERLIEIEMWRKFFRIDSFNEEVHFKVLIFNVFDKRLKFLHFFNDLESV